jgi:hypothetical protein
MPLWQGRNLRPIKSVTESGAEQTVVDRATNLKQQISLRHFATIASAAR